MNIPPEADMLAKVLPLAQDLAAEHGREFAARHLNLSLGFKPKSKWEVAFRDELLRRIWQRFPGEAYPVLCMAPPEDVIATHH